MSMKHKYTCMSAKKGRGKMRLVLHKCENRASVVSRSFSSAGVSGSGGERVVSIGVAGRHSATAWSKL